MRSLATSFGFSIALSTATVPVIERSEEPPAKRRKSVHPSSQEPSRATKESVAVPRGSFNGEKRDVGRHVKTVVEESAADGDEGRDSSVETAKKRKDRAKKTRVYVELNEEQATKVAPAERPRRRAAVSASAKVTEGFAEEAAPIDRKRRDPEPVKPARKGYRQVGITTPVKHVLIETHDESKHRVRKDLEILPQAQKVVQVEPVMTKNATCAVKRKLKAPGRLPLRETDANVPSTSPKKHDKLPDDDSGEVGSPTRLKSIATQAAMKKRRGLELSAETEALLKDGSSAEERCQHEYKTLTVRELTPGELPAASAHRSRKAAKVTFEQNLQPTVSAKRNKASISKVSRNIEVSRKIKVSQKPQYTDFAVEPQESQMSALEPPEAPDPFHLDRTAGKQSQTFRREMQPLPSNQSRPRAKKLVEAISRSQPEEDVEWLFDTAKVPNLHTRGTKRKPIARLPRAMLPDLDLDDDMLSSIASWCRR